MPCGRQSGESLKSESGNHLRKGLRVLNETGPEDLGTGQFWVEAAMFTNRYRNLFGHPKVRAEKSASSSSATV
jgi:hypothetical protein